jgi:hypothetical protein
MFNKFIKLRHEYQEIKTSFIHISGIPVSSIQIYVALLGVLTLLNWASEEKSRWWKF